MSRRPRPAPNLPIFVHVPKTGGCTIRDTFPSSVLFNHGHRPARNYEELKEGRAAVWSFAFVRDPWERMVSWYYWRERANATRLGFAPWLLTAAGGGTILTHNRSAKEMLTAGPGHPLPGRVLVDTVFRFERWDEALVDIARRLGVSPAARLHSNRNAFKSAGLGELDPRALYTQAARARLVELCGWEVERFGYRF